LARKFRNYTVPLGTGAFNKDSAGEALDRTAARSATTSDVSTAHIQQFLNEAFTLLTSVEEGHDAGLEEATAEEIASLSAMNDRGVELRAVGSLPTPIEWDAQIGDNAVLACRSIAYDDTGALAEHWLDEANDSAPYHTGAPVMYLGDTIANLEVAVVSLTDLMVLAEAADWGPSHDFTDIRDLLAEIADVITTTSA
jgi:hypothetical protein